MGVDEGDFAIVQEDRLQGAWSGLRWKVEERGGFRTRYFHAGPTRRRVHQLDIIHDDEAVEVGPKGFKLVCRCFKQELAAGVEEGGAIALYFALCIEDEVKAALAWLERLNGIGDHAVQPANGI